MAILEADLPAAAEGSKDFNKTGSNIALGLSKRVLLKDLNLLDLGYRGEIGCAGFVLQQRNIHGSDSVENAAAEVALWFRPDELIQYQPADASWVAGG